MTIAPALAQLVEQVSKMKSGAKYEYGDKDGIGFVRSVTFDAPTSKAMSKVFGIALSTDDRIATVEQGRGKKITVTVVADTRADHRTPYPLEAVEKVLNA